MKVHAHVHLDDCIPAYMATPDPDFFRYCKPSTFGKDDYMGLVRFWQNRERKFRYKSAHEVSSGKAEEYDEEADLCETRYKFLLSLVSRVDNKPPIFTKPVVRLNERVAFFVEDPDRFLVGSLKQISVDEEAHTGDFTIRAFDHETGTIREFIYEPDGISLFPETYLVYFRNDPEYFRAYLDLHAWDISTQLKAERLLAALPAPTPPEAV